MHCSYRSAYLIIHWARSPTPLVTRPCRISTSRDWQIYPRRTTAAGFLGCCHLSPAVGRTFSVQKRSVLAVRELPMTGTGVGIGVLRGADDTQHRFIPCLPTAHPSLTRRCSDLSGPTIDGQGSQWGRWGGRPACRRIGEVGGPTADVRGPGCRRTARRRLINQPPEDIYFGSEPVDLSVWRTTLFCGSGPVWKEASCLSKHSRSLSVATRKSPVMAI